MEGYILRDDSLKAFNEEIGINSSVVVICFEDNKTYCMIDGITKISISREQAQRFISTKEA